ncbi:MAG: 4-amino-4-deoxy-L-arabinose transferase-like glycosyltransferase, partial [Candidatus Binatia bacterium]
MQIMDSENPDSAEQTDDLSAPAPEPPAAPSATTASSASTIAAEPSLMQRVALVATTIVVALAIFAPAVIGVPFYTKGEPREGLVVQAIVATGEVVLPYRNGDEIPSKPPFFHWMGSLASLAAGGVSEATIRTPSVIAAIAAMTVTVLFAARWFGLGVAYLTIATLLTAPQWTASAVTARVDMMLSGLIIVGLFTYFRAYTQNRQTPALVWACAAAATLTKGPIGLALPGAIVFAHLALRRDWTYMFGRTNLKAAFVALLAIVAWYAGGTWIGGQPFLDKLILKENVMRVLDGAGGDVGHLHPFYWYFPALLGGLAPWSLFLPVGIRDCARAAMAESTSRESADPNRFLGLWLLITFVVFSLADSKRGVYLLPAYPAAALMVTHGLVGMLETTRQTATANTTVMVWIRATVGLLAIVWTLILLHASGLVGLEILDPLMSRSDQRNLGVLMKMIERHALPLAVAALAYLATAALAWRTARTARQSTAVGILAVAFLLTYAVGGGF